MAEPLGADIAGAEAIRNAFQLCKTMDEALHAAGDQESYQQTSQELINILHLIKSSPHLQTPEIISCTNDLIGTANRICSTLRQRKRNRFIASIASAIKHQSYKDLFACLERQKAALARCISRLEAHPPGPSSIATMTPLQGNTQESDTFQVVGMEIRPNTSITDTDLTGVTSDLNTCNNIYTGKGTQVIGQRVHDGAERQRFNGHYSNNIHRGVGDQVIGFSLE